jgi:hypothetical protein
VNAANTMTVWMQTVEGGFTAWEIASVALLFVRWVASHLPTESSAESSTPDFSTLDATTEPVAAG